MLLNGAEILVQALLDEGVTDVFGYPGGALLEIFDALAKSPINNVLARQEQGAVHEASGYLALVVKDSKEFTKNHNEAIHLQIRRA